MRVHSDTDAEKSGGKATRPSKKVLEEGKFYNGTIPDYKILSFPTKRGTGYALKLTVKPDDLDYFATTAFDFIGMDETGPYINKNSKMEGWLKTIFNVPSLDKVILEQIKGKPITFKVKNENREWANKDTGVIEPHLTADVVEVFKYGTSSEDLTAGDFKDSPKAATPAASSAVSPTPKVATPEPPTAKAKSKWANDEEL